MFKGLDHIAIVVPDTEKALKTWCDKFSFPVLFSEKVNNDTVLLMHLDLGNTHLQLVEPLVHDSPLHAWLAKNGGPGLHHFCLLVDDVGEAFDKVGETGMPTSESKPHQGTKGKRALFLDKSATEGVQVELTGA